MKLKITKSDKKALLAALAVCGIGILFSILIVLGMDIYRLGCQQRDCRDEN
jgi:hypothetical protein